MLLDERLSCCTRSDPEDRLRHHKIHMAAKDVAEHLFVFGDQEGAVRMPARNLVIIGQALQATFRPPANPPPGPTGPKILIPAAFIASKSGSLTSRPPAARIRDTGLVWKC
jgi:hypothetical protein